MKRRPFRAAILAFIALLPGPLFAADAPPAKPNIIFILSDDVGLGNISCSGGAFKTPNIDALAKCGTRKIEGGGRQLEIAGHDHRRHAAEAEEREQAGHEKEEAAQKRGHGPAAGCGRHKHGEQLR